MKKLFVLAILATIFCNNFQLSWEMTLERVEEINFFQNDMNTINGIQPIESQMMDFSDLRTSFLNGNYTIMGNSNYPVKNECFCCSFLKSILKTRQGAR